MNRERAMFGRILVACVIAAGCGGDDDQGADAAGTDRTETERPTPDTSGRIVFQRLQPGEDEPTTFTVNPDGSDVEQVFANPTGGARWSPDRTELAIFCCDDGMAAHFLDVETGDLRTLEQPDPALEAFCGMAWSPDGERLACEVFGIDDPSRNGIYSIRTSDGGDFTRITSIPGGTDIAGDYSPDGTRLVFMRFEDPEQPPVGLFVTNVDGSGLRQLTPPDMVLDESGNAGSWSPVGDNILFVARTAQDDRKTIWIVNADGGTPVQLPITPACGGPLSDPSTFGCYSPSWSPDGDKIVFVRSDGSTESIYIVNADGSGLVQVTDGEDDQPDWASG